MCLGLRMTGSDPLHVRVEAKSSLYLCTESSLKRDFTLLMWADRWILEKESRVSRLQRGEQKILPRLALTSQTCGFVRRYMPTLRGNHKPFRQNGNRRQV